MKPKLLSPIKITDKQREWLERQQDKTGNSFASTVRNLIQEKIQEESKHQRQNLS